MLLYKKINLPFVTEIQAYAKSLVDPYTPNHLHLKVAEFPEDLKSRINDYFKQKNVSPVRKLAIFKRNNTFADPNGAHIDSVNGNPTHCSIIVPVEGAYNSYHVWYKGKFSIRLTHFSGVTSESMSWHENPTILEELCIADSPVLARVDIPHAAYTLNTDICRVTATFRFEDNETFEYLSSVL